MDECTIDALIYHRDITQCTKMKLYRYRRPNSYVHMNWVFKKKTNCPKLSVNSENGSIYFILVVHF